MHICFITHEYPKIGFPHGGLGSFVKTIALELVKNNVKVTVLGINYTNIEEFLEENEISIHRLKPSKIKGLAWFFNSININKKLKEINRQNPINVIETPELGLCFLNKIKTIKYVIRLHGGHHFFAESEKRKINFWKGFQEKKSFKKADAFVAVSKYVKNHTEKYLSFNNKNVSLINYPIDSNLFSPSTININDFSIVFAGTVCEKKGVRQLIQAFEIVNKKFPNATLNIFGRDWLYKNGSSYTKMLIETELPKLKDFAKNIFFNGAVDYCDIPAKYATAEVCVFPSHMETQGLVAPEAMAMEKMVIFTNRGPGKETIKDFETGLLCNPQDPIDIANKICWVFENKQESKIISINARNFVINKYGLSTITNQNIAFYKTLINTN